MQAPTSQERDRLDQMDIVIGLADEETRCLLHVWRACDQTATVHAPKQVTGEFQRTIRERRPLSIEQEMHYNGGVIVEAV